MVVSAGARPCVGCALNSRCLSFRCLVVDRVALFALIFIFKLRSGNAPRTLSAHYLHGTGHNGCLSGWGSDTGRKQRWIASLPDLLSKLGSFFIGCLLDFKISKFECF